MKRKYVRMAAAALACTIALAPAMAVSATEQTYTVEKGDSLSKISKKIYGTTENWKAIYERNKDTIKDPNVIWANQQLILPDMGTSVTIPQPEEAVPQPEQALPQPEQALPQPEQTAPQTVTSETQQWIDSLYNALIQDDAKTVVALLGNAENVRAHCTPYAYAWNNDKFDTCEGFLLTASDGTKFGVGLGTGFGYQYIDAFVSASDDEYGFHCVYAGDHYVEIVEGWGYNYLKGYEYIEAKNEDGGAEVSKGSFAPGYVVNEWHL